RPPVKSSSNKTRSAWAEVAGKVEKTPREAVARSVLKRCGRPRTQARGPRCSDCGVVVVVMGLWGWGWGMGEALRKHGHPDAGWRTSGGCSRPERSMACPKRTREIGRAHV